MGITDPRDGGRAVNLLNAAPQLAVTTADGRQAFDSRLDIDGDGTLEKHELTSTLLTVARIAAEHNISVRDVQINGEISFTPDTDFAGTAQLTYLANTPEGGRAEATGDLDNPIVVFDLERLMESDDLPQLAAMAPERAA